MSGFPSPWRVTLTAFGLDGSGAGRDSRSRIVAADGRHIVTIGTGDPDQRREAAALASEIVAAVNEARMAGYAHAYAALKAAGLSTRAANVLARHGVRSADELKQMWPDLRTAAIDGCLANFGGRSIEEIDAFLMRP